MLSLRKLCLVGNGWQHDDDFQGQRSRGSIDLDFYGDMRLHEVGGQYEEYVARFTHGTLEWIRPIADVPPVHRYFHPPDQSPE